MLAAAAAMAVTGCGGSSAGSETSGTTAGTTAGTEASSDELMFVLGGTGPLTGATANYGNAVKYGEQLAVEEINAAGGINGYQIKWLFEDDENDAEKVVNAYNALSDQGMQILVGATTAGPTLAITANTEDDHVFQMVPSSTAADVTKPENVFRMTLSGPVQGEKAAAYIADHQMAQKVGVIYDSSDTYSADIYTHFAKQAEASGLEVVDVEAYTNESKTDFKAQLTKLKDAGAELVFMPIYYTEASLILQQAKELNYAPQFFGGSGMDGILDIPNFDKSVAEDLILITSFAADPEDAEAMEFVNTYKEKFDVAPLQFSADAYDSVYVVKAAAEKAGLTPDMDPQEMCDKLMQAMTEITYSGLTGKDVTFTADGESHKDLTAVVIKDGEYNIMK
ncbi:MAG: ABC transporter substrate-binding protein [Eubacteriales bacterium]|nr:ABC transporter substrate-binding protein [Eubacteriales bacterium]